MTCTAMSGSGARTGMMLIRPVTLQTPQGRHRARTGCIGAAAGSATPGSAARRFASITRRATGTTSSVFALPGLLSFWFFTFLLFAGVRGRSPWPRQFFCVPTTPGPVPGIPARLR